MDISRTIRLCSFQDDYEEAPSIFMSARAVAHLQLSCHVIVSCPVPHARLLTATTGGATDHADHQLAYPNDGNRYLDKRAPVHLRPDIERNTVTTCSVNQDNGGDNLIRMKQQTLYVYINASGVNSMMF